MSGSLDSSWNPLVGKGANIFLITNKPMQVVQNVVTKLKHPSLEGGVLRSGGAVLKGAKAEVFSGQDRGLIGSGS